MFQRMSCDLLLLLPPTWTLFNLFATSLAARLLKNSIQPSVKFRAILSRRLAFSFKSEANYKLQIKLEYTIGSEYRAPKHWTSISPVFRCSQPNVGLLPYEYCVLWFIVFLIKTGKKIHITLFLVFARLPSYCVVFKQYLDIPFFR